MRAQSKSSNIKSNIKRKQSRAQTTFQIKIGSLPSVCDRANTKMQHAQCQSEELPVKSKNVCNTLILKTRFLYYLTINELDFVRVLEMHICMLILVLLLQILDIVLIC